MHQSKLKSRFSFCERIVIEATDVSCVITDLLELDFTTGSFEFSFSYLWFYKA